METYFYTPLVRLEGAPYGIPMGLAALQSMVTQKHMLDSVKAIVEKMGLLGLTSVSVTPPSKRINEDDVSYERRVQTYFTDTLKVLLDSFRKGLLVHNDNMTVSHSPVGRTDNIANQLWQTNEEQIMSGLAQDPAMFGRSYSTTETYAGVVYTKLQKQLDRFQYIISALLEKMYTLDLQLNGIDATVTCQFSQADSLKPLEDAQAEKVKLESIAFKRDQGWIDQDQAAREAGYEEAAADPAGGGTGAPSLRLRRAMEIKAEFKNGRYEMVRPLIKLLTAGRKELSAGKDGIENYIEGYLRAVIPFDLENRKEIISKVLEWIQSKSEADFKDADQFADEAFKVMAAAHGEPFAKEEFKQAVADQVKKIYSFYRLKSTEIWSRHGGIPPMEFAFNEPDRRALDFLDKSEDFFFSKYIDNDGLKNRAKAFFKEEFDAGMFGRGTAEDFAAFRKRFAGQVDGLSDWQVRRIIDTSSVKMRNWGHMMQCRQAGIQYAQVSEILDAKICGVCRLMHGKLIPVKAAAAYIDRVTKMSEQEYLNHLTAEKGSDLMEMIRSIPIEQRIERGKGLPPFHPGCRGKEKAFFGDPKKGMKAMNLNKTFGSKVKARYNKRLAEVNNMTPFELKEQVKFTIKNAEWDPENLKEHFNKPHKLRLKTDTEKKYARLSHEVLNKAEAGKCITFTQMREDGQRWWHFCDLEKEACVAVNETTGKIATLYYMGGNPLNNTNNWFVGVE